jgi:hypothetical protein
VHAQVDPMKYCNLDGTKSVTGRGVEGVESARARACERYM